jgi:amino acid adenylation domain-containing protein
MQSENALETQLQRLSPEQRAQLMQTLNARKARDSAGPTAARLVRAPLSFAQRGLWLMNQVGAEPHKYNMVSAYRLHGPLDRASLESAFQTIVARHRILRSRFALDGDEPCQEDVPDFVLALPLVDLGQLEPGAAEQRLRELLTAESRWPFDLQTGPLLRLHLYRLAPEQHVLQINVHHAVFDGWSKALMFKELAVAYSAARAGITPDLPPLTVEYADFAAWQVKHLRDKRAEQLAFWKHELGDAEPLLHLPIDFARPPRPSSEGGLATVSFDAAQVQALRLLAQECGATLFMAMLTVFKMALYRCCDQADICVATPVDNRSRRDLKYLIGYFLNTVILRSRIEPSVTFRQLLGRLKHTTLEAFRRQEVPFEDVIEAVSPARSQSFSPLHQVAFVFQHSTAGAPELAGLRTEKLAGGNDTTKYDLYATFREEDSGLLGWFTYRTDLFRPETIESFVATLYSLLAAAVATPDQPLALLPTLTDERQRDALSQSSAAEAALPPGSVARAFFERASLHPRQIAIHLDGGAVTYGALAQGAERLAAHLGALGVRPGTVVGVHMRRSEQHIEATLAAWMLGAAVVPLDTLQPDARLAQIVRAAAPVLIVHDPGQAPSFAGDIRCVSGAEPPEHFGAQSAQPQSWQGMAADVAFLLFTSGSTGVPKGVIGTHRGLLNRVAAQWQLFQPVQGEIVAQRTNIGFVDSFTEVWSTLLSGGSLVIIGDDVLRDPFEWIDTMANAGVTSLYVVPSLFRVVLEAYPDLRSYLPTLRRVTFSGEPLTADLIARCEEALPELQFVNVYGATEAADVSAAGRAMLHAQARVPVGRPLPGMSLYVLDDNLQLCPTGVEGALYAAGISLALGYHGNAQLTAERFVPNPFVDRPGERMYFLGDRGRRLADGRVEFLGRRDTQVKLRGLRIELGEIEHCIESLTGVLAAVVVAVASESSGEALVAYVQPEQEARIDRQAVARHVATRLPDYMRPAAIVLCTDLPHNVSGKIDRRALRERGLPEQDDAAYRAPATETEQRLTGIWQELLRVERISVDASFLALGGHSLLAMRLVARVRETFAVRLAPENVFELLTIARQAAHIDAQRVLSQGGGADGPQDEQEVTEF